jgi:limonene-1,2-epoxide hydrolase
MASPPIDTVHRFWEALYARDWDALRTFFVEDSLYYDVPTGGLSAARGPERIEARLRLGLEPLSEYRHRLRSTAAAGSIVFTEHQEQWVFPTGEVATLPFVSVQTVDDAGHILLWKDYWDFATLMNAAPAWWHQRLADADLWWVSGVPDPDAI